MSDYESVNESAANFPEHRFITKTSRRHVYVYTVSVCSRNLARKAACGVIVCVGTGYSHSAWKSWNETNRNDSRWAEQTDDLHECG